MWLMRWQKCIFQPAHNGMKCVLIIKESYSKGKKESFTQAYGQAGRDDAPPLPYGQPLKIGFGHICMILVQLSSILDVYSLELDLRKKRPIS